jgi:uncharacterized membrane protein
MAYDDAPLDIYVAAYGDAVSAQQDWDGLKELAKDKVISVEALVLVSRDDEGKIHVTDNAHDAGLGAAVGAVGGAIIGLIFPPALLASAAVGAGIGAGAGFAVDQVQKHQIKSDLEEILPPGSSGIVAVFEERWVTEIERQLRNAAKVERHQVDVDSVESVKAEAAKSGSRTKRTRSPLLLP